MTFRFVLLIPAVLALSVVHAGAQVPEFRTRGGLVSEEVALAKLKHYGVTDVRSLREAGGEFEIQGSHEGRPVKLQMNERTGVLRESGQLLPLLPARQAFQFMPVIDDGAARQFDQLLRFEVRPQLDRTMAPEHVHPEHETPR